MMAKVLNPKRHHRNDTYNMIQPPKFSAASKVICNYLTFTSTFYESNPTEGHKNVGILYSDF